jgi:hypothetical protein
VVDQLAAVSRNVVDDRFEADLQIADLARKR